jgi:hypothetical protein
MKEQKSIKGRTNGVIHFQYQNYDVSNEAILQVAELVNIK